MTDLGKKKVEEDITETHREVLYSSFLGDWARTQLSPDFPGRKVSWGNLPRWPRLGTLHPCWRPSTGMGVSKVELTTWSPCCPSIMWPLDLLPCDILYSGLCPVFILHQKHATQQAPTMCQYCTVLYQYSVVVKMTSPTQYRHPEGSFCSREVGLMNVQLSKCYNHYVMMLMDLRRKWQFSWGNWEEHLRKDIRWGGCQRMSGT